ncbi:MAG: PEGA domain-containing protein, partial [Planctomycetota bacterium]
MSRSSFRQTLKTLFSLAAVLGVCLLGGCVRRRMTVRTNPPGAAVSVDNQPIGMSPAATGFVNHGPREFRIEKPGFKTEVLQRRIYAPWYQWPGIDFIAEALYPWELRDEHIIDVQLV